MIILWLLVGSLLVTVPFYVLYDPYNLWPSVYGGGIGAAVYLVALLILAVKNSNSIWKSGILTAAMILFLVASYVNWTTMDTMSSWQRSLLGKIRTQIGYGVLQSEDVCDQALPVFAAYSKQKGRKKNITQLFREFHTGKIRNGIYEASSQPDYARHFVRYDGDTTVLLISVDTVARGMRLDFANINGSVGRLQTTTRISAKGVRYERNN